MENLLNLQNKVVVITGASGLIGKRLAHEFMKKKCKLVLVDLPSKTIENLESNYTDGSIGIACDVAKSCEVAHLKNEIINRFSRIDILINCHQFKPSGFLDNNPETFPEELWNSILDANLKGTFLTCREIGKQMISQKKGVIINFASVYGVVSSNPALYEDNTMGNPIAYSASKGGIIMMSKYLATYWAKHNIRVNCITPHGVFNNHEKEFIDKFSSFSPMRRLMKVEEVVGGVLFLASDLSSYVTGTNLVMDGGWTAL